MDLTSGFHQTPLEESVRPLTAFITPGGLYEWIRVPMGIKGAPSYFQKTMASEVLAGLIYNLCEVYLDDIIVHGRTETEFLHNLRTVFTRLRQFGITLRPDKCRFGLTTVEYCGHTIDQEGIHFSTAKLQKVVDFSKPRTITELRSFLGLANYYRDHVFGHSMIVHPLHQMLDGKTRSKSKAPLTWTTDADEAFEHIKERIQSCPKLFFLRDNADIVLETDASDYGVGGYLYQTELNSAGESVDFPVTFISQALTREQKHWSTPQKEAYAIYYCITELDYLLCDVHFTLRTDHKNLIFLNMDTDKKVHRWKLALQEYDFTAVHIPGKRNVTADFL
ncbi:MAG: hypothetical protein EBW68_11370, partial [Actinobacteria bacterium]|nr:hypothetical protein [Actinomycetota bacterium]